MIKVQMTALFILFLQVSIAFGQLTNSDCRCTETSSSTHTNAASFALTSGQVIGVCGVTVSDNPDELYSDFHLVNCLDASIIQDYDGYMSCRIFMHNDTLCVQDVRAFPTGANFDTESNVWCTDKYYNDSGGIVKATVINRRLRKYSSKEIEFILLQYKSLRGTTNDSTMTLLNQMFIAALGGDDTCRRILVDFELHHERLDGAFAEDYRDLLAMLRLWDRQHDK